VRSRAISDVSDMATSSKDLTIEAIDDNTSSSLKWDHYKVKRSK
jgi:hypothetical protein